MVLNAPHVCSVHDLVLRVFASSSPCKIVLMVVCWVAIDVTALHTSRTWSEKRYENQFVYKYRPSMPIVRKSDSVITTLVCRRLDSIGIFPRPVFATPTTSSYVANRNDCPVFINGVTRITWDHTKTNGNGII